VLGIGIVYNSMLRVGIGYKHGGRNPPIASPFQGDAKDGGVTNPAIIRF
jgi:hypothetical protein